MTVTTQKRGARDQFWWDMAEVSATTTFAGGKERVKKETSVRQLNCPYLRSHGLVDRSPPN